MDEYESLSHTKWECKYHVVFIPKCRRKTLYVALRKRRSLSANVGTYSLTTIRRGLRTRVGICVTIDLLFESLVRLGLQNRNACILAPRRKSVHLTSLLWNHGDPCNGMYFHPLRMKRVLHVCSNDAHMSAHRREMDLVFVALARRLAVRLSHREPADDLEYQVPPSLLMFPAFRSFSKSLSTLSHPCASPSFSCRTPSGGLPPLASTIVPVTEMHCCFTMRRGG